LVWKVWTEPEHIAKWWGPNGFTNTIHKMDVKPDGEWEFIMHGPDGTDYKNKDVYHEVVKPERLVYTHVNAPKHEVFVNFAEIDGGKTELTMRMLFESAEQLQDVIKIFKADDGQKQTINKLEAYLATF
jgi:uncharacterized protein YndB with AHSA1/START domain